MLTFHNVDPTVGFAPTPSFTCDIVAYQRHNAAFCRNAQFDPLSLRIDIHLSWTGIHMSAHILTSDYFARMIQLSRLRLYHHNRLKTRIAPSPRSF